MKKVFSNILIPCMLLFSKPALAGDVYRSFFANRFDMYLDSQFFKSTSNYDANGSKQSLPGTSSFQNISLDTSARFLFFNNLGIYSGFLYNYVDTSTGAVVRNTSALTHYFAGADYQLLATDRWTLYLDFTYLIASTAVDAAADVAIATNGANEAKAVGVAVYSVDKFRLFTKLGYDFRTEGLSALLLYGAGGEVAVGNVKLGLALDGFSSVKDDDYTSQPLARDAITDRVNAGSRRYYAVNPNLLDAQVYFQYSFGGNMNAKISAGSTITGSNAADGISAGLALNWGFGVSSASLRPDQVPNRSSLPDQEQGFKVDTNDGVNQEIFKPVTPALPKK